MRTKPQTFLTGLLLIATLRMTANAQPLEPITLPSGIQVLPNEHPLTLDECLKYEHTPAEVDTGLNVNWGPTYIVSNANYFGLAPRISLTGDYVYVVWNGEGHGVERSYICTSIDRGGNRWNTQSVSSSPTWDTTPAVAGVGRVVHAVSKHQIIFPAYNGTFYWRSTNGGLSFNTEEIPLIHSGFHPAITAVGNYVNVIADDGDGIVHCLSTNGGSSFLPPDTIASLSSQCIQPTRLVACQNYVYAAFLGRCNSTNQLEIYFTRSTDYGRTFEPVVMLSTMDQFHSQCPSLGYSEDGDVYVGWYDYKYSTYGWTGDILLRFSHNFGASFEDEYQLTFDHLEVTSMIAAQDSQVHVVYEKNDPGPTADSDLYYRNSSDRGATWSNEVRLTYYHGYSACPDLAVKNDTLHLVWEDERYTLSYDVFYRRGIVIPTRTVQSSDKITSSDVNSTLVSLNVHPNPYNSVTQILFNLAQPKEVNLSIINLQGKEVIDLCHQALNSGDHSFAWSGVNQNGQPVSAGVYLAVLKINGQVQFSRKIVYLK